MKMTGKVDFEAPIAFVFEALCDFDGWERAALRRGAEIMRTDALKAPAAGMAWTAGFNYKGKPRKVAVRLTGLNRPDQMKFSGEGALLAGEVAFDLMELGARRTRLTVQIDVTARTLGARLFLQSLKLARGRLQARLDARLAQLAADADARFKPPKGL